MLLSKCPVYVYSVIPRLSVLVKEKLPNVQVFNIEVTGGLDNKYQNVVMEEAMEALLEAEVLLVDNNLLAQMIERLPRLKWAQSSWAGAEDLVIKVNKMPKLNYPITRMVGENFSQLMSEYAVGWIIAHERSWLKGREYQNKSQWHHGKMATFRSLKELSVAVLGMGHIGKHVAKTLKAFKTTVHAYTRSAVGEENKVAYVDRYWHTGELETLLGKCDYIINVMPSTPETRGILGGNILQKTKKCPILMNIGRGNIIEENDLIKALDCGWISQAILDVFAVEPLPSSSLLWTHPKVIITPHVAGVSGPQVVVRAFIENYGKFINGLPLNYVIDFSKGY